MRGATILSKRDDFFKRFVRHLKTIGYPFLGDHESSFLINPDPEGKRYFMFYGRDVGSRFYERYELPNKARKLGYRYAYMVECRCEQLFCDIVKSTPTKLDILVVDTDSKVYKPSELDPKTIYL